MAAESDIDKVNLNAAFAVVHAGFLRFRDFTYKLSEAIDNRQFTMTKVTRASMTIHDDHAVLTLPRSKTDKTNTGVNIPIAATDDDACSVAAMRVLINSDPQQPNQSLFRLLTGPFD